MKKDPVYKLFKKKEAIGLLCNQSAWHPATGKYSFQSLAAMGRLKKVFVPEHGLFGELQDQVKLDDTSVYTALATGIEWISLYNSHNGSHTATVEQLEGLDTLVIDIQDTGSRYYTYTTTTWLLLKQITDLKLDITVVVFDRINPAGRIVEGTRMSKELSSFIGLEGLPHRHGLTIGELCLYFKAKLNAAWDLVIHQQQKKDPVFISPSPNIPGAATCGLYSGQCLWEGTNISEGRGTTLPFETIGAPFLHWTFNEDWNNASHPTYNRNCYVRPVMFNPVFHKFTNTTCSGIHLMVRERKKYHSLAHSLQLINYVKAKSPEFEWRQGQYEAFSDKKAIELLVGDQLLLDYAENKTTWKEVKVKLQEEENAWINEASPFLVYKKPLHTVKI